MRLETIAIVGATQLGRRIALDALRAGYRTILEDISLSTLEQATTWMGDELRNAVPFGEIGDAFQPAALANLSTANSAEDASRSADLIIETVSDEVEMKVELFTMFDKFAKPGAIFATTGASVSVTELAAVTFCPERCIGMHFLAGADVAPQTARLELLRGRETSDETVTACREVGRRMGWEVALRGEERMTRLRSGV